MSERIRIDRRRFLCAASVPLLAGLTAGCARRTMTTAEQLVNVPARLIENDSPAFLPAPDLSDGRIQRFVAGIRPFREGAIRLKAEQHHDQLIVHNYGHGGAGITLSWGSAEKAARLVRATGRETPGPIAVLGGGVMGLTTAHELARAGFGVTVYAESFTPNTTSDVAGGQWAPSIVATGRTAAEQSQFTRILRRSHARFTERVSEEWGVSPRRNYQFGGGGEGLAMIPRDLVPRERVDPLPFPGREREGWVYHTLLIEPPVYLPRLMHELHNLGVVFDSRVFTDREEIRALPQQVIVNCLGLGSRSLFGDARLTPVRGQLVHLSPQDLPYMLSHGGGYIFPRRDAVVLGGSVERNVDEPIALDSTCRRIVQRHRRFFE